jgi:hypothetical protein
VRTELLLSQLNKKSTLAGQEERFYTKLKKLLEEDFFFLQIKIKKKMLKKSIMQCKVVVELGELEQMNM